MVADAASRYDYAKLTDLGLQVSHRNPSVKISTLRQKLDTLFITPSHLQHIAATIPHGSPTNPFVETSNISHSLLPSKRSHTGLPISCLQQNPQLQNHTSPHFIPFIMNPASPHLLLMISM